MSSKKFNKPSYPKIDVTQMTIQELLNTFASAVDGESHATSNASFAHYEELRREIEIEIIKRVNNNA